MKNEQIDQLIALAWCANEQQAIAAWNRRANDDRP